jgi:hypothetical protein
MMHDCYFDVLLRPVVARVCWQGRTRDFFQQEDGREETVVLHAAYLKKSQMMIGSSLHFSFDNKCTTVVRNLLPCH